MKFATLPDGTPDGRLHVISRTHARCAPAQACRTLQAALENWNDLEADLKREYQAVNDGSGEPFVAADAMAPLPRAWQWLDGSAFESHSALMQEVFKLPPLDTQGYPLMYQGTSDFFYGAHDDVRFPSEADGIDFEGEYGVLVDRVPMGSRPGEAATHIRLVVQINDWSLRNLAPREMKTGFGWVQAKPPCSMAPVAVTPDELGLFWRDARVDLPLVVDWNGTRFGAANGYAMGFGFDELVAHAAYSRDLVAGTVLGSGTVSNRNYREVGSSCIAERRGIETLDHGEPQSGYMKFGDRVRMEAVHPDGSPLFGAINQKVVGG